MTNIVPFVSVRHIYEKINDFAKNGIVDLNPAKKELIKIRNKKIPETRPP